MPTPHVEIRSLCLAYRMPLDNHGEIMDKLIGTFKTIFITSEKKSIVAIEPKGTAKPTVAEKFPTSQSTSTPPKQPGVTQLPQMTRSSTSNKQSFHTENSFLTAARNGDLDHVQEHLHAKLSAGAAFHEAVINNQEEVVQLLLSHVTEENKLEALKGLINKANDHVDLKGPIAIGSLILSQLETPAPFLREMSKFHAKAGDEEATLTSVMALRSGIENGALCKMAADGDGYGIYEYLKMAGAPDINTRSFGELNPLAEAAKKNHQGIVGMLLPHANEETKIDALVELTMVAPGAYPIDPFVATGRMLYKALETPDSSIEIVRNRTEPDPMESSMVPVFLADISQS